jgi:hypothetical protein
MVVVRVTELEQQQQAQFNFGLVWFGLISRQIEQGSRSRWL